MSEKVQTQGTVFEVQNAAGTYVEVEGVTDVNGPGGQAAVIDATTLRSTAREKNMGLPDEGQVTLDLFWDPADTGQARLLALRSAQSLGTFRITYADTGATTQVFTGYVVGAPQTANIDDLVKKAYTIEVTGAVTEA